MAAWLAPCPVKGHPPVPMPVSSGLPGVPTARKGVRA
jgi:hypothetical protein